MPRTRRQGRRATASREGLRDERRVGELPGAQLRPQLVPERFSGIPSEWRSFLTKYEIVSELNGWTEAVKAKHLVLALPNAIVGAFSDLRAQASYEGLVDKVARLLEPPEQQELRKLEFRLRTQNEGESLGAFARALEALLRLAYPGGESTILETLLRDQFIEGLREAAVRLGVRMERPRTMAEALSYALEKEAILKVEQRRLTVGNNDCATQSPVPSAMPDSLSQIFAELRQLREAGRAPRPGRGSSRNLTCWGCGAEGHVQARCPRWSPGRRRDGGSSSKRFACWDCGAEGHIRARCPRRTVAIGTKEERSSSGEQERALPATTPGVYVAAVTGGQPCGTWGQEETHASMRRYLKASHSIQKERYVKRTTPGSRAYNKGEQVWLWNTWPRRGQSARLQRPLPGMFVVVKALSEGAYRIQDVQRPRRRWVVEGKMLQSARDGPSSGGRSM